QVTPDTAIALEATGNAFAIYDALAARAGQVAVAHPAAPRRLGAGRHTDRVDAERLARRLALGTLPQVWVPPAEIRALRTLIAHVTACQETAAAWKTRAQNALLRAGWAVPAGTDLARWLAAHGTELDQDAQLLVTSALTVAAQLEAEAERVRAEVPHRVHEQPALQRLWSIPGIGPWTAVVIWAWLGDPHRFRRARQVTRYAGFDPTVHQSGQADWRGHISRQGPPLLRKVLVQAAWQAVRQPETEWAAFYRRVVKRLGPGRAIVAVARKLLLVAWRIWREGRCLREVDRVRYAQKLRRIQRWRETHPRYPWAERLAQWGIAAPEAVPQSI
ncbi:MAG: IS110 family transposase, partial [Firmicutes bacterium]|nr:IS110 family transposase [Bacillota bacterium]